MKTEEQNSSNNNLESVNFLKKKSRQLSPNSLEALASLGIEEERLYYVSFEEFLQKHPELKNVQKDLQERRYNHFEEKKKKIYR